MSTEPSRSMEPEFFYEALRALRARDGRFPIAAYLFVFEALDVLSDAESAASTGVDPAPMSTASGSSEQSAAAAVAETTEEIDETGEDPNPAPHVSAQDLLDGMRRLAIAQFGYMARTVLTGWNVHSCADWGEVVFSLVECGLIKARPDDRKEDFAPGYDFAQAFDRFDEATVVG